MAVIFFSLSLLHVCATGTPINKSISERPYDVPAGEQIRVVTKNEQHDQCKVLEITGDSWQRKHVEMPLDNTEPLFVKTSNDPPVNDDPE